MSADEGSRLELLFAAALEVPVEERAAYLEVACADEPALRREIEELLAVEGVAGRFFDRLAADIADRSSLEIATAARPKIRVGPYRAVEAIGRGGMGVVYRAIRWDGEFEQEVALKLLHLDMHTPRLEARFRDERQLLARLEHRNIARLLDGGVTDEGRPYFVMELVEGLPITTYCRERRTSLPETLAIFLQVIDAVSYLHRNLIVHRDLKPSNLLVRRDGLVKLLDFGIAKLLESDDGVRGLRTTTGEQLLTPQYAAPEQLTEGRVTTATDVFGLGAVLYELLAGRRGHATSGPDLAAPTIPSLAAPSDALRDLQGTAENPSALPPWRRLPRDLDNVCLKALRSEPERRYASAEQLGRDLERHLEGLPVSASADSFGYRLGKFLGRHRKGLAAAGLVLVLLGGGFQRERELRGRAEEAALRAEAVSDFLGDLFSSARPDQAQGETVTVLEVLRRAERDLEKEDPLAGQPGVEAEIRFVLGRTYQALGQVTEAREQLEEALRLAGGVEAGSLGLSVAVALGENQGLELTRREELLRQALAIRERALGPDHPDTLSTGSALAGVLVATDRLAEAEALDRRVLETRTRVLGADHRDTLRAANALASDEFAAARYASAAALYEGALERARPQLGPSHPETLRLAANLGATYSTLGRYRAAEPLLREVVEQQLRVLGDAHHSTGIAMHNLAVLLLRLARWEDAERWLRRAVAARAEAGGAGLLYSQSFLADSLMELGRPSEAEALYRETLASQRELLAPGHPDTFRTTARLAELEWRRGDLAAADELASSVLAGQLEVVGDKGVDAADTLELLARIRTAQGRLPEAIAAVEEAHASKAETFPPEHPAMLLSRLEMGRVYLAADDREAAGRVLEGLPDALARALGPDHPRTSAARLLVGALVGTPSPPPGDQAPS